MKNTTLLALCLGVGTVSGLIAGCPAVAPVMSGASPMASATMMPSMMPSGGTSANPTTMPSGSTSSTNPSTAPTNGTGSYKQIERLARPAINEALLTTDALHNTWNSVGPSVDLTSAAKPIADEATKTLKAFGNTDAQVAKLFGALLPDVMRIDTTHTSGYAGTASAPLANVEASKGIPVGGRMITDDTIDVTLLLAVPDQTNTAVPGLRSDNVSYDKPDANGHVHKPVMASFPYAPAPN